MSDEPKDKLILTYEPVSPKRRGWMGSVYTELLVDAGMIVAVFCAGGFLVYLGVRVDSWLLSVVAGGAVIAFGVWYCTDTVRGWKNRHLLEREEEAKEPPSPLSGMMLDGLQIVLCVLINLQADWPLLDWKRMAWAAIAMIAGIRFVRHYRAYRRVS